MEHPKPFKEQWKLLRRYYQQQFYFFTGIMPFTFLFMVLLMPFFGAGKAAFVSGVGYMVIGFVFFNNASLSAKTFVCPRCGEKFFRKGNRHSGFTRRCLNCGLKKYASD